MSQLRFPRPEAKPEHEVCVVCDDHDGWWLDDETPPTWEPCWAHEPLPDHVRKETPAP